MMASGKDKDDDARKPGKKVRVPFRRNRGARPRVKDVKRLLRENDNKELDAARGESIVPKGEMSRQRTIIVRQPDDEDQELIPGVVIAVRGLFVDVDDGSRVYPCTIRRVLRTRLIADRSPITVGDRVRFRLDPTAADKGQEGVIEKVEPRHSQLRRMSGKRVHPVAVNVDQAIIVSSARQPTPKPNLIDRYIVAALSGQITPVICMNKIDLDLNDAAATLLQRYAGLGYATLRTSSIDGRGIDELRALLKDKASVIAGQSGVGKSSLLNAVDPALGLRVGHVIQQTEKGRHTTTTATMIRLPFGGYVVDTPGVRSFDLTLIPREELEAWFVEFVEHVAHCRFPDCTHTHETDCAVKAAVERGHIDPERYASYLQIYADPGVVG